MLPSCSRRWRASITGIRSNPTPDPDWCVKDAGGGRPPSDDVIAKASTREAYDLITGCGADGYKFELSYVGILPAEQNIFAPPESALPG